MRPPSYAEVTGLRCFMFTLAAVYAAGPDEARAFAVEHRLIDPPRPDPEEGYTIACDLGLEPGASFVECWPRSVDGVITATTRAARLSMAGRPPHEVHGPDGRVIARFVRGQRADL